MTDQLTPEEALAKARADYAANRSVGVDQGNALVAQTPEEAFADARKQFAAGKPLTDTEGYQYKSDQYFARRLVADGATQQDVQGVLRRPGARASLARKYPALVGPGEEFISDAIENGAPDADLYDKLMRNSLDWVKSQNPGKEVVPVERVDGQLIDVKVDGRPVGLRNMLRSKMRKREEQLLEVADKETGAGWARRLSNAMKMTQTGEINNLRENYDKVLPLTSKPGAYLVWERGSDRPILFDESGMTWRDVFADTAGEGLEMLPGTALGIYGGMQGGTAGAFAGGAVGDLFGTVLRAGASKLAGGEEGMSGEDYIMRAAVNMGAGALGEGVTALGRYGMRAASPTMRAGKEIMSERVPQNIREAVAGEGGRGGRAREMLDIEKEVYGGEAYFTPAQITGGRGAIQTEEYIRQRSAKTMAIFQAGDEPRILGLAKRFDTVLDEALGAPQGAVEVVQRAGTAYRELVDTTRKKMLAPIRKLYEKAHGGGDLVDLNETIGVLERMTDEVSDTLTPASRQQRKQLQMIRQELRNGRLSLRQWDLTAREFGRNASGKGSLVSKMDPATSKRWAKQLYEAMQKDLDNAAAATNKPSLRRAQQLYKEFADWERGLKTTYANRVLAAASSDTPETFISKFWTRGTTAHTIEKTMPLLREASPEMANQVTREIMEAFAEKAAPVRGLAEELGAKIGPAQYASAFKKERSKLKALLPADTFKSLERLQKAASAVASTGKGGSQTAILQQFDKYLGGMISAVLRVPALLLSPRAGLADIVKTANATRFAIMMNDPARRNAAMRLAQEGASLGPAEVMKLVTRITATRQEGNMLRDNERERPTMRDLGAGLEFLQ